MGRREGGGGLYGHGLLKNSDHYCRNIIFRLGIDLPKTSVAGNNYLNTETVAGNQSSLVCPILVLGTNFRLSDV
jgi:hypothetical protein